MDARSKQERIMRMCKVTARLALALLVLKALALRADEREDLKWVKQQYPAVLGAFMGEIPTLEQLGDREFAWVVTARISPGFAAPESQIIVTKEFNGTIEIRKVTLSEQSLWNQLLALKKANPDISAEHAVAEVRVIRKVVSLNTSHSLRARRLVRDFEALRMPLTPENVMLTDPSTYDLWVDSGVQVTHVHFIGSSLGNDDIPIIRWIRNARNIEAEPRREGAPVRQ